MHPFSKIGTVVVSLELYSGEGGGGGGGGGEGEGGDGLRSLHLVQIYLGARESQTSVVIVSEKALLIQMTVSILDNAMVKRIAW